MLVLCFQDELLDRMMRNISSRPEQPYASLQNEKNEEACKKSLGKASEGPCWA